ncbi:MAG: MotA/TolQ/ExbB proton channel family protein [Lentimicrobiaceae bacterium]|jgi:biopolymer transport protein ExbB|nr:MotA/TolQ/ExbB proton channel family protein [Lentimicrobiaceae bacterium]MCP4910144.1 MotA/TolQ/ExbB proton channel family protein [Bacteroidota bacterium]MBT3454803.1 MotA/TolQ/ExbB proton channel family protein [Lentimicrobiaceae bacterium]MBT3817802.1 MotA/TolQ/ExbB proton channel family protein [Lentimicrobiaceae bacterium]MBT4061169.1 MotA/TolQ/ExbB proton channel family protein [Lentimicrobiaceae bacterium]
MRKFIALLSLVMLITAGFSNYAFAQENAVEDTTVVAQEVAGDSTTVAEEIVEDVAEVAAEPEKPQSFHQVLKEKFIEGGPGFMGIVLLALIFGLAISIERIIYLSMATINTKKLLGDVDSALNEGGIEKAQEVVRGTKGPVASIFGEGLNRYDDGLGEVEKSIIAYGSVVTGRLESGVSWISLFIALAPMLGFMGTVIGMIKAFDDIAAAGDISPTVVADGIKVALLTTVFGLIVAIILQIFYNYIISKIENLVNDMEDSSIAFIDILNQFSKK